MQTIKKRIITWGVILVLLVIAVLLMHRISQEKVISDAQVLSTRFLANDGDDQSNADGSSNAVEVPRVFILVCVRESRSVCDCVDAFTRACRPLDATVTTVAASSNAPSCCAADDDK